MSASDGDAGREKEVIPKNINGGGSVKEGEVAVNMMNQVAGLVKRRSRFSVFYAMASVISNFFGKHFVAITNLVIVALTYGGEELLEIHVFRCPCDHSLIKDYTLSYVLGICFFLWIAGISAYSATWKVCHGFTCCKKCWTSDKKCKACCCSPFSCYYYGLSMSVLLKTSIVPAAWLFFVLADGDYYACMESKAPCENGIIIVTDEYRYYKSYSGKWAYIFLASFMAVALLFRAVYRCCAPQSFLLHKYIAVYKEIEEEEFIKQMPEAAKKLAPAVVQAFLDEENLLEEDWEKASEVVMIKDSGGADNSGVLPQNASDFPPLARNTDKNTTKVQGPSRAAGPISPPVEKDNKAYYSPLHKCVVMKGLLPKNITSVAYPPTPVTTQPISAAPQATNTLKTVESPQSTNETQAAPETNGLQNNTASDSQ